MPSAVDTPRGAELLEELAERGLRHDSTDVAALAERLTRVNGLARVPDLL